MSTKQWIVRVGLSEEQKERAYDLALSGASLETIAQGLGINVATLSKLRQKDLLFDKALQVARLQGLENIADNLLTIPLTYADVNRARVMSDNLKWLLSKRIPKSYGDKMDLTISGQIDLSAALREAKSRTKPIVNMENTESNVFKQNTQSPVFKQNTTQRVDKLNTLQPVDSQNTAQCVDNLNTLEGIDPLS